MCVCEKIRSFYLKKVGVGVYLWIVVLLLCVFYRTTCRSVKMGVKGLWGAILRSLGYNADKKSGKGLGFVQTMDKNVGIELFGLAFTIMMRVGKEPMKAKPLALHANRGEPLADPELAITIAFSIVEELTKLASACKILYVVAEKDFVLKRWESKRRTAKANESIIKEKYNQALRVTDCIVKLVKSKLETVHNINLLNPVGEAETQLMFMLSKLQIDLAIVGSGDADTAIYNANCGTLVVCPQIRGQVTNPKFHGRKGVELWGKAIHMGPNLWRNVGVSIAHPKQLQDLTRWTIVERAVLAFILGHDYDPSSNDHFDPSGIFGMGIVTAVRDINSALDNISTYPTTLSTIERIKKIVQYMNLTSRSDSNPNFNLMTRITTVVLGFMLHPVLNITTGHLETFCRPDSSALAWIAREQPEFSALVLTCNTNKKPTQSNFVHVRCENCGIDFDTALISFSARQVKEVVKELVLQSMKLQAQPMLSYELLVKHFVANSKASDFTKHVHDGTARAFDNADRNVEALMGIVGEQCTIQVSEIQSYDQGDGYTTLAQFTLTADLKKIKSIDRTICTCYKNCTNILCKHRAALLCFLWINTVNGTAGLVTERQRYWERHLSSSTHEKAWRLIECCTDRTNQQNVDELVALDVKIFGETDVGTITSTPTKRATAGVDDTHVLERSKAISDTHLDFAPHIRKRLGEMARKHAIKRMCHW
eukprot:m.127125 g.127125  ORF g.127125 m.127125 type:complete len:709 (+) comp29250_c0_seq2:130-2256(+)